MKKLLIYFIMCSLGCPMTVSFDLGHQQFAQIELQSGITREAWYKKKLEEQEKHLRDTIIAKLNIAPDEWAACLNKARETVLETGDKIKQQAKDIRGNWVANYTTDEIYKTEDPHKKLADKEVAFTIDDTKINEVKRMLKDFGYSGEVITLYPAERAHEESLTEIPILEAYLNFIAIRPGLFLYNTIDQAFRLRHELSHFNNQDMLFEHAVENCISRFFRADFDPVIHQETANKFDVIKLKKKNMTLNDIDQIHDLFFKTWWNFQEYRADMDAVFAMKNYNAFKQTIKNKDQYMGYPLENVYRSASAYEKTAPVPFIQDFIEGLINDKKRNNNPELKRTAIR